MSRWQQIRRRDWSEIREVWLEHVPPIPSQGARPTVAVEAIIAAGIRDETLTAENLNIFPEGLREAVLWEALFLLHKGGHTIGAAEATLRSGRMSWSQFDAYHGAFMACRAVMAF